MDTFIVLSVIMISWGIHMSNLLNCMLLICVFYYISIILNKSEYCIQNEILQPGNSPTWESEERYSDYFFPLTSISHIDKKYKFHLWNIVIKLLPFLLLSPAKTRGLVENGWYMIEIYNHLLNKRINLHPGWCGSVNWAPACQPKNHWFNSQSGNIPGL